MKVTMLARPVCVRVMTRWGENENILSHPTSAVSFDMPDEYLLGIAPYLGSDGTLGDAIRDPLTSIELMATFASGPEKALREVSKGALSAESREFFCVGEPRDYVASRWQRIIDSWQPRHTNISFSRLSEVRSVDLQEIEEMLDWGVEGMPGRLADVRLDRFALYGVEHSDWRQIADIVRDGFCIDASGPGDMENFQPGELVEDEVRRLVLGGFSELDHRIGGHPSTLGGPVYDRVMRWEREGQGAERLSVVDAFSLIANRTIVYPPFRGTKRVRVVSLEEFS